MIEPSHPQFRAMDALAFAAKNRWNLANDHVRHSCLFQQRSLTNTAIFPVVKATDAYQALPSKGANHVRLHLHQAWKAFFEAMDVSRQSPKQFPGRPRWPHYLQKTPGRSLLVCELGCMWKAELRAREIAVSQLGSLGETQHQPSSVRQVRVVPKAAHDVLAVVYAGEARRAEGLDPERLVALDPAVNVLAALTSKNAGFVPRLVSGKPLKALKHR